MIRKGVEWLDILEETNDSGILLLMDDHRICVDDEGYIIINEKSYIAKTLLINRIDKLSDIKRREKIINELL
tara:strand:+ start:25507 stop:25722 length:216 start_codon:yes stop_codon:yes gene_type:complete